MLIAYHRTYDTYMYIWLYIIIYAVYRSIHSMQLHLLSLDTVYMCLHMRRCWDCKHMQDVRCVWIYIYIWIRYRNEMKWMRLYNYYTCSHWLVHISLERCSVMSWVWSRCSQGKDSNCNPADQALCALCPPSQCTSGEFPRFSVIISLSSLAVSLLQVSPPFELKHKLLIIIVYYILLYNIIYILQGGTVATRWQFAEKW